MQVGMYAVYDGRIDKWCQGQLVGVQVGGDVLAVCAQTDYGITEVGADGCFRGDGIARAACVAAQVYV